MVLRTILRNVQHTLILASVLLVTLALQRLQHYEFPRSGGFMDEEQHGAPPSFGGNSIEEESASSNSIVSLFGSHHQVVLGREFNVGLFRFFLPRLERTTDESAQAHARKQEWEVVGTATSIHYVVDFLNTQNNATTMSTTTTMSIKPTNVCDPSTLDAATVLQHSLENKKILHAIVDSEAKLSCNATSILTKIGYHVVPSNSISLNGCSELWQAYAMQKLKHVDVVVHLPVTAIAKRVIPTEQLAESRRRERRRALLSSVYSSSQPIQLLRPKQFSADSSCATPPAITVCHASPCQISRHISLLVPPPRRKECILPWSCRTNTNLSGTTESGSSSSSSSTLQSSSAACRIYHHLWTQTRNEAATTNRNVLCRGEKYMSMNEY